MPHHDDRPHRIARIVRASQSADGLVLLDVDGGLVLASNDAGARIWTLVGEGRTPSAIAEQLAAEYAIDLDRARRDVTSFIAALTARGMIAPAMEACS